MPTSRSVRSQKSDPDPPLDIPGFDASVLEALLDLGARQRQLEEFRERADSRREAVTPAVFQRVVADYHSRLATLKAEAAPLKRRVRAEYQKLREVADSLRARLDAATLDKEELEFRRDLGEMDIPEFETRVEAPAGVIAHCQQELDVLEGHSARFREALGPDDPAPDSPQTEPEPEPEPEVVTTELTSSGIDVAAEMPFTPDEVPEDATQIVTTETFAGESEPTILGSPELFAAELLAQSPPGQPAPAPVPEDVEGETQAAPQPVLVLDEHGVQQQFPLGVLSYIGRSEGNQVQLAWAGVSRRHAMIALGADGGYIVKDLQSQNGTFLNGDRITEARLSEGDRITVGDAEVTFQFLPSD